MFKLLLVEDEELVRKSILSKLDWKEIGFDKVFEAEDGEQALEIALKVKPNVVLSDIRMPFMDGLELSQKLLLNLPTTKIVLISGHDEFQYAHKAIEIGVSNYVLKPITASKLKEVLLKTINQIHCETLRQEKFVEIENQVIDNLPLLKEKFFNALLNSELRESEISENLKHFNMDLSNNLYFICVLEIDNLNLLINRLGTRYLSVLKLAITNIITDALGCNGFVFNDSSSREVIVFNTSCIKVDFFRPFIYDSLLSIKNTIKTYLDVTVTAGIGLLISSLLDFKVSYEEALNALDFKFSHGNDDIYDISNTKYKYSDFYFPINKFTPVISAIKFESLEEIRKKADNFLDTLIGMGNISSEDMKLILFQLINELHKIYFELNKESVVNSILNFDICKTIHKCETIKEVREVLLQYIEATTLQVRSSKSSRNLQVVEKAKQYINENYSKEDLSLITVANIVSVSPGYLSIIFKKETNITFIEYITKERMEKAKELLKLSNLKSYEVAYQVGFKDPHYFSICFKKFTGLSPSDYINSN